MDVMLGLLLLCDVTSQLSGGLLFIRPEIMCRQKASHSSSHAIEKRLGHNLTALFISREKTTGPKKSVTIHDDKLQDSLGQPASLERTGNIIVKKNNINQSGSTINL